MPPRRVALLVCGPPGSGKSTVGALLARAAGAALLDLDTATLPLTSVVSSLTGSRDLDSPELAGLTRAARYETLTALMVDNLGAGLDVVAVAPFTTEQRDPAVWAALTERLSQAGGDASLVWLRLPAAEASRRVAARAAPRDLAKASGGARPSDAGGAPPRPTVPHLEVDALLPPDVLAERILLSVTANGTRSTPDPSERRRVTKE